MSLVEAPLRTDARPRGQSHPVLSHTTGGTLVVVASVGVALVVVAGVALRFATSSDLWLDEVLSVSTARLPLTDIPSWLRHDGAPPLYYMLLHVWTSAFGTSDAAVRALSGVFSVATIPAIYFAGRRLGGKTCAWAAVVILASSSFAIRFGTEARMYALVSFLVVLGYLALHRVLEHPSTGRVAALTAVVAALLYTQYWSAYLVAAAVAVGLALALRARTDEERRAARGALVGLGAGIVLFLPWIPTVRYQTDHLRAEFGSGSGVRAVVHDTLFGFAGGSHLEGRVLFWLLAALCVAAVLGVHRTHGRLAVDGPRARGVRIEALVIVAVLALGAIGSYVTGAIYYARYASVIFPLFVLVLAYGVTRLGDRRVQGALLVAVAAAGLLGGWRNAVDSRTEASRVAAALDDQVRGGDVVAYCPDMVAPAVQRIAAVPTATSVLAFPRSDPLIIDWTDYIERHAAADPIAFADRALAQVSATGSVWLVSSTNYQQGNEGKCEAVRTALGAERAPTVVVRSNDTQEHLTLVRYASRYLSQRR